jgi:hypothetical protein
VLGVAFLGRGVRPAGQAECVGGLEVDDQLELGRLHDRQVGRLLAPENPAGWCAALLFRQQSPAASPALLLFPIVSSYVAETAEGTSPARS